MGLNGTKHFKGPTSFKCLTNVVSLVALGEVKPLTGDEGCVVWSVGPQVLCGLGGRLRQALRASAVTYTGRQRRRAQRSCMRSLHRSSRFRTMLAELPS